MANTKISALTANTNPTWLEELVYAYNNANGKMTLNTMKSVVWWAWITTLNADANIWELSAWIYETTHDLYYISWETIPASSGTKKQMLFVIDNSWEKWFFVFNEGNRSGNITSRASYWHSVSSSEWDCKQLWRWDESLIQYWVLVGAWLTTDFDSINPNSLTQLSDNVNGNVTINVSTTTPPYKWVTYTLIVNSVASWQDYTIVLWNWVTNPLGITLPSSSTKKCVITLVTTSATTAIITWCTIAA